MPWGLTWQNNLKTALEAHFLSTFGRELIVDMRALAQYLTERGIADEKVALAHFKRVMLYYKEKYKFIPRFSHLLSTKIPVVETDDWEAALYKAHPDFQPYLFVGSGAALSRTRFERNIFDAARRDYYYDFASAICNHPSPVYCYKATVILERLVYSIAKHEKVGRRLAVAAEAHTKMRKIRVVSREEKKPWVKAHFSKALVRKQYIPLFGLAFTFWELPKLLADPSFGEGVLNCKLTEAHKRAILTVVSDYGYKYKEYLPFLIQIRSDYVLRHRDELAVWSSLKPEFVPQYPYW